MNDVIEVRTNYDEKDFLRFNRFHVLMKNKWMMLIMSLIFFVIGLAIIITGDFFGIVYILLSVLLPAIMLISTSFSAKSHLKSNKIFNTMKNIYCKFDSENIYHEVKSTDFKAVTEFRWNMVHRIFESKDSFYFYINDMQAYIVPKKDIVIGNVGDLRNLVTTKTAEHKINVKLMKGNSLCLRIL